MLQIHNVANRLNYYYQYSMYVVIVVEMHSMNLAQECTICFPIDAVKKKLQEKNLM